MFVVDSPPPPRTWQFFDLNTPEIERQVRGRQAGRERAREREGERERGGEGEKEKETGGITATRCT